MGRTSRGPRHHPVGVPPSESLRTPLTKPCTSASPPKRWVEVAPSKGGYLVPWPQPPHCRARIVPPAAAARSGNRPAAPAPGRPPPRCCGQSRTTRSEAQKGNGDSRMAAQIWRKALAPSLPTRSFRGHHFLPCFPIPQAWFEMATAA